MKICVYVVEKNAKLNYAQESYNVRLNAGMAVVVDILRRSGYHVDYAGIATVHNYDYVLVSITSDCDWWPFIAERIRWQPGDYKVVVGGAGVLNVRPFLPYVDYFVLGRAEGVIDKLLLGEMSESVVESKTFNPDRHYKIEQTAEPYPHAVELANGREYKETAIGCNHRCLYCGYTWHRKNNINKFRWDWIGERGNPEDKERALMDWDKDRDIDYTRLRTTAIDGMSERLRFMVNKKITRTMLREFIYALHTEGKPHQVKFYNILGYPGETEDDWWELVEDIRLVDEMLPPSEKQTSILLHSTPFRPVPATPLACAPMSYRNYRGEVARVLGQAYRGNIFYQGRALWAVESMGTESLPTVILSAIGIRGTEEDTDNVARVAASSQFWKSNSIRRQRTLEKYFDVAILFSEFTPESLPTRYLRTYASVEEMWPMVANRWKRGDCCGE